MLKPSLFSFSSAFRNLRRAFFDPLPSPSPLSSASDSSSWTRSSLSFAFLSPRRARTCFLLLGRTPAAGAPAFEFVVISQSSHWLKEPLDDDLFCQPITCDLGAQKLRKRGARRRPFSRS